MMTRILIAAILLAIASAPTIAARMQLLGVGGGGPPPGCSNSLDFSDGCNSQYLF